MNRILVLLSALTLAAPAAHGAKPQAPVTVVWDSPEVLVPGRAYALDVVVTARASLDPVEISLRGHLARRLYEGSLSAGETLRFPVRFQAPRSGSSPLIAVVQSDGWRVGAKLTWQPPVRRVEPRRDGEVWLFEATRQSGHSRPIRPAAPQTRVVMGTFLYRDRLQDPLGFINSDPANDPMVPIRLARVEVYRDGKLEATAQTDLNGFFEVQMEDTGGIFFARVQSRLGLSQHNLSVRRATTNPSVFAADTPGVEAATASIPVDLGENLVEAGAGGEAFNMLDVALTSLDRVQSLGETPAPLVVYWNDQAVTGPCSAASCYSNNSIWIRGPLPVNGTIDSDGYDDTVVVHEIGHYVANNYSTDGSPAGPHFFNDSNQDPRLSWSEGWASFWQSYVRLVEGENYPSWYIDTTGMPGGQNLFFAVDCEGPTFSVAGSGSELAVQAALWEIIDDADTPHSGVPGVDDDNLALDFQPIWDVVSQYFLSFSQPTLETFWEGWFSLGKGSETEMQEAFGHLGAEYVPDAQEPNDSFAIATPYDPESGAVHGTFYGAGDVDYFRVPLQPGDAIILETLNTVGWADTRLQLYNPDMQLMAENDDRASGQISSSLGYSVQVEGDHFIRVSRVSKNCCSNYTAYGSYDMRLIFAQPNQYTFSSIGASRNVDDSRLSVGAVWADFNADARLDLAVVNNPGSNGGSDPSDALYRQLAGAIFADATGASGMSGDGGIAAAAADYDNDGDTDLFLSDHVLYSNDGTGHLVDVSAASQIVDLGREFDADWVDADRDGLLDLFVTIRDAPSALWRNQGDGTFANIAGSSGFSFPPDGGEAWASAWGDYDGDGWPDVFVCFNSLIGHALYHNLGDNTFEEVTVAAEVNSTDPAVGVVWGDVNGDGWLDAYVSSLGNNKLYQNDGDGTFTESAAAYGVAHAEQTNGALIFDYDLDGDNDLFITSFTANGLHENVGLTMALSPQAGHTGFYYTAAAADYDLDGDPDIYVTRADGANLLLRNETMAEAQDPQWLKIALTGVASNRDGLGALIRVFSPGRVQTRQAGTGTAWAAQTTLPLLFGIPGGVDSVRVDWPSGAWNVVADVAENSMVEIIEDTSTPVLPPESETPAPWAGRAFPNPFASFTALQVNVSAPVLASLRVYDIRGALVSEVFSGKLPAGEQRLAWNGRDARGNRVPEGVYFMRLTAGERSVVRKVVRVAQ